MGWLMVYRKYKSSINFLDKLYQQKRISKLAWDVKRFDILIKYLPGAMLSFVLSIFESQFKLAWSKK
jgi:hypothetical protein